MDVLMHHIPSYSSNTSLVRVNGDELAAKVNARLAELMPKIPELRQKLADIREDYYDKATAKNLIELEYIQGQAKIDIKKAFEASVKELPPKGIFQALFGTKEYFLDTGRFVAEVCSLKSKMPEDLKDFWVEGRVRKICKRYNWKDKNGKIEETDIAMLCSSLIESVYETNINYWNTSRSYYGFSGVLPRFIDYDYKEFQNTSKEINTYIREIDSLERYKNLKGDVFLAINEYNALGELV